MNIDEEFKKYTYKKFSLIIGISFIFFIFFKYNFGIVLSSFIVWVFLILGMLFLYLDLKFMFKFQKLNEEVENMKYILQHLNKRK